MVLRPPRSTRTGTHFADTTRFRSDVAFAMALRSIDDVTVYGCNTDVLDQRIDKVEGSGWVTFELPSIALVDGTYLIDVGIHRPEEHTSELQSLMRISYAVFCLKKQI